MGAERLADWAGRLRSQLGTVRVRTTLAAAAIVGVALLAGSIALVTLLRDTLVQGVESATQLRVEEVAATLATARDPALFVTGDNDEELVQILDQGRSVVASSPQLASGDHVPRLAPGQVVHLELVGQEEFVVAAGAVDAPSGPLTVVVARSLEDVSDATRAVTGLLATGLPILLLLVAGTTWRVVGRALAPVESIRAEVDRISGTELYRRVVEPPADDEISRLATTMNRMLGRLEQSSARQRQFVSDASHELRGPVTSIRQHAEVASRHPDRTTLQELAKTVLVENDRVQGLVEDLLLLARADESSLRSGHRSVDLDDLVFDEVRHRRDLSGVRVDATAVGAGRVLGDPVLLARMIRNLADNASRHARSVVAFSLREDEEGTTVLTVDDDGAGIPVEQRSRVFERFVRLDEARARDHGGAGLGLAIVAEVVGAHSGTATVTNSPYGGTRIEVRLPSPAD